jgi:hypothetical protein
MGRTTKAQCVFVLFTTHHTSSCFAQKHAVGASGPFVSWYLHHASEINEATTLILLALKATSEHKTNPTNRSLGGTALPCEWLSWFQLQFH